MPEFPPSIDVRSDVAFQAFANGFRMGSAAASDMLNTTAAYVHPMIIGTLRKYGLDGTNRFGFGSSAQKAADSVVNKLKRAAGHYVDGGQLVVAAYVDFVTNVWTPFQLAKKAAENGDSARMLDGA